MVLKVEFQWQTGQMSKNNINDPDDPEDPDES